MGFLLDLHWLKKFKNILANELWAVGHMLGPQTTGDLNCLERILKSSHKHLW